jgi:double-stranded uracil-DNA glycosylase
MRYSVSPARVPESAVANAFAVGGEGLAVRPARPETASDQSVVMMTIHSFDPIGDPRASKLILGSMPGRASLLAHQYYAHPRNLFWPFIESIFGIPAYLPYPKRCEGLTERGIAVWDVLKACTRSGSLDSDIIADSMVPNDFERFLADHPGVGAIYFNGATAEKIYRRYVVPGLKGRRAVIPTTRLPSTSPANAATSLARKRAQWQVIGHSN